MKLRCVLSGGVIVFLLSACATSPDMRNGLVWQSAPDGSVRQSGGPKAQHFRAAKIIRPHVSMVSGVSANIAPASATSAGCSASIVTTRFGPGNQARCPEGLFHSRWRISCPSTGSLTGDIATRYADGPSCLRALPVFAGAVGSFCVVLDDQKRGRYSGGYRSG